MFVTHLETSESKTGIQELKNKKPAEVDNLRIKQINYLTIGQITELFNNTAYASKNTKTMETSAHNSIILKPDKNR